MTEAWESSDEDATEYNLVYNLVLPFLDQSPAFTHGFEIGWQYARMQHGREKAFQQAVHSENQRQLVMAAKTLGWSLRFEPLDDTFSVMHAEVIA